MDKNRFDRALAHVIDKHGCSFTARQREYLESVRDIEDDPIKLMTTVQVRDHTDRIMLQALAAVLVAVSQGRNNILYGGINERICRQWTGKMFEFMRLFEDSTEFAFSYIERDLRSYCVIKTASEEVRIDAEPLNDKNSNLRGIGTRLRLLLLTDETPEKAMTRLGSSIVLPLLSNGCKVHATVVFQ